MSRKTLVLASLASLVLVAGAVLFFFLGPRIQLDGAGREEISRIAPGDPPAEPEAPASSREEPEGKHSPVPPGDEEVPVKEPASGGKEDRGQLAGQVLDPDGRPLAGVILHAVKPRAGRFGSAVPPEMEPPLRAPPVDHRENRAETDEKGKFTISGLEPGQYALIARGEGYRTETVSAIQVEAGETKEVEVLLQEGMSIEGIVLDPGGKPVPAAEVTIGMGMMTLNDGNSIAIQVFPGSSGAGPRSLPGSKKTTTDGEGRFRMTGLSPGNYSLTAEHPDWAPATVPQIAAGSRDVKIQMQRGGSLSGVVLSSRAEPVAGAFVSVSAPGMAQVSSPRVTTDDKGRFTLGILPPGKTRLRVRAGGYPSKSFDGFEVIDGEETTGIELVLEEGCAVTGVVLDPLGQPLAGASVRLGRADLQFPVLSRSSTTDSGGRFRILELRGGNEYRGKVSHQEYASADIAPFPVESGTVDIGTIRLLPAGSISGKVLDPGGIAVKGARVSLAPPENASGRRFFRSVRGEGRPPGDLTGADGSFRLSPVPAGEYQLQVTAPGFPEYFSEPFSLSEGETIEKQEIHLREGATISGVVLDSGGNPLPGVRVSASHYRPHRSRASARTDEKGVFRMEGLEDGNYDVTASLEGLSTLKRRNIPVGGPPLRLVLEEKGSLSGVVFDAASRLPVKEFSIKKVRKAEAGAPPSFRPADFGGGSRFNDPGGEFLLPDLDPGRYSLEVRAKSFVLHETEEFEILPGQNLNMEIPLEHGGAIEGVVVDGQGRPIQGARLSRDTGGTMRTAGVMVAMVSSGDDEGPSTFTLNAGDEDAATTDGEGRFLLAGLPPGKVKILVEHEKFINRTLEDVSVVRNTTSRIPRVELEKGATLFGTVFDSSGKPTGGAFIMISSLEGDGKRGRPVSVRPGPDGSYSRSGLKSGKYRVQVNRFGEGGPIRIGDGPDRNRGDQEVDLKDGESRRLDFPAP